MLLFVLAACQPDAALLVFPEGFRWGSATAGFQVEAGCPTVPAEVCEDRASDWYQWVTDPELVADGGLHLSGDPMSLGPGHYELYAEDLARAGGALGHTAFRFSFEWSRLFPDGAAEAATTVEELAEYADPAAMAWYAAYLDAIVAAGLEPVATLNHYTLPLWVHDGRSCHEDLDTCTARGWVDGDRIVPLIALYSGFVAQHFGDRITWWLTLNEPMAVITAGYTFQTADRTNPPGVSDMATALEVAWNMAQGHAAMSAAVHAQDPEAQVGVVVNLGRAYPMEPEDPEDVEAAEHLDYVYNQLMLDAFLDGRMDMNLDGVADTEDPTIAGSTDWLGLNYYFALGVQGFASPLPGFGDYAYMDFFPQELDPDPAYIGDAIDVATARGLPVWITENGVANPTDSSGEDFLLPTLRVVQQKAAEGADLRGYLYWALIDNYEWNHGMNMRFGLYEVDLTTKTRTLRPIGQTYQQVVADGGLQP